jgi:hypothetical protein
MNAILPAPHMADPCTEDSCVDGQCIHEPLCPEGQTCCPSTVASGEVCQLRTCSFTIDPASACAGSSVTMTLEGWCDPECESNSISTVKSHPYLTVTSLGGSTSCVDASFTRAYCLECIDKHLGAALVLLTETREGYAHSLRAIGHLPETEDESQAGRWG